MSSTSYCLNAKSATLTFNFPNQQPKIFKTTKTPLTVIILPYAYPQEMFVPEPGWGNLQESPTWRGSESFTWDYGAFSIIKSSVRNWDDFICWFIRVNHNNIESLQVNRAIGDTFPVLITPFYDPTTSGVRQEFVTPFQVWDGDIVQAQLKPNAWKQLGLVGYFKPAKNYLIMAIDGLNRRYVEIGLGKPNYNVACDGGNCPPNTLDCGDCCLDCETISSQLNVINTKLSGIVYE